MLFNKIKIKNNYYEYVIRNKPVVVEEKGNQIYINYSKLINILNPEDSHAFRNTINTAYFAKHITSYINQNDLIKDYQYKQFTKTEELCKSTNNLFYQVKGGDPRIQGTYGPYELIDLMLAIHDPIYVMDIHKIMHEIDVNATLKGQTFNENLNQQVDKLKKENEELIKKYKELKEENEDLVFDNLELNRDIEWYKEHEENHEEDIIKKDEIIEFQTNIINKMKEGDFSDTLDYSTYNPERDLRERQTQANLVTFYLKTLNEKNQNGWKKLKQPSLIDMLKIIKPTLDREKLKEMSHDELIDLKFEIITECNGKIDENILSIYKEFVSDLDDC